MARRTAGRLLGWIMAAGVLGSLACAERERLEIPSPGGEGFTLGPVTEYPVPAGTGAVVVDSLSGGSFSFPEGGSGTLAVARLLETPTPLPEGGWGFWVEYEGDEKLELRVPSANDTVPCVYIYGFGDVSPSVPMESDETWWPVMPEDTLSNPAVFPMVAPGMPETALLRATEGRVLEPSATTAAPIHSYRVACRKLAKSKDEWFNQRYLKVITQSTIQDVIDVLPPTLKTHATSETSGRLALRSYKILPSGDLSAYSAFLYYTTYLFNPIRRVYPMMSYICKGPGMASSATVAHEVGHYLNHVFFGDDAFEAITRDQLVRHHDFGTHHPQRHMLEEYAMIVDYFKNGDVTGGINVEEPHPALMRKPSLIDFPGLEGYATCLMARMVTSQDTIIGPDTVTEDIPVIGMSFTDLLGLLYAEKPVTLNHLRAALATWLTARSKADRLPVVLERTGWSYNGAGSVVDASGMPIVDAEVQSVCKVASLGSREYLAPLEPVKTDVQGRFTLPRIFPGTNTIRVKTDTGLQDFTFTVDANRATDDDLSIPQLKMSESLLSNLQRMKVFAIYCQGIFTMDDGHEMTDLCTLPYASFHQGQWTGSSFTIQYADSTPTSYGKLTGEKVRITATFSSDGRTLTNLKCQVDTFIRWDGEISSTSTSIIDVDDLPLSVINTEEPGHTSAYFDLHAAEIDPKIRTISFVSNYYPAPVTTHTITQYNWTDTSFPGRMGVSLTEYFGGGHQ